MTQASRISRKLNSSAPREPAHARAHLLFCPSIRIPRRMEIHIIYSYIHTAARESRESALRTNSIGGKSASAIGD